LTQNTLDVYRKFVASHPNYERVINLEYLPHEKYQVDELWRPESVKILFLAEGPSWHSSGPYFYDPEYDYNQGRIGKTIFHQLGIKGKNRKEQLEQFKDRGYLFMDVIKCIYDKNKKNITQEIIEFSGREFLQNDLADLSPKVIFLLGKTPLRALKSLDYYKEGLSGYKSITKSCGSSVELNGRKIIFCVFPSSRNFIYQGQIQKAFELLS